MWRYLRLFITVLILNSFLALYPVSGRENIPLGQILDFQPSQPHEEMNRGTLRVMLPFPELNEAAIPAGLTRSGASEVALHQIYQQADPIINQLNIMQQSGLISGFNFLPDQMVIDIQDPSPDASLAIRQIPGLVNLSDSTTQTCLQSDRSALVDQVLMYSQIAKQTADQAAPSPNFDIAVLPSSGLTYVTGYATPTTPVTLTVIREATAVITESITSDINGFYAIKPSWISVKYSSYPCTMSSHYSWTLLPDDIVQISYGGEIYTGVVASLQAWVNPDNNIVEGVTGPNQTVEIHHFTPGADCAQVETDLTVTSDSIGYFGVQLNDFDGRASADIYVRDMNGNRTWTSYEAFHLLVRVEPSVQVGLVLTNSPFDYEGVLMANSPFKIQLIRDGNILATVNGITDAGGILSSDYATDDNYGNPKILSAGDLVTVSDGVHAYTVTVQTISARLEAETNRLSGTTTAGQHLRVEFSQDQVSGVNSMSTTCSPQARCFSLVADASGIFYIPLGVDVNPGDRAKIFLYDSSGNSLFTWRYAPTLILDTRGGWFHGFWSHPMANLTITYKDQFGNQTGGCSNLIFHNGILLCPVDGLHAGNTITVIDNETGETRSMIFPAYDSTELDNTQQVARGVAHNANLAIAQISDYRPLTDATTTYCRQATVNNDQYSIDVSDIPVGAQDSMSAWHRQTNGNYMVGDTHAFLVEAIIGNAGATGYTIDSYEEVAAKLYSGDVLIATDSVSSDMHGNYSVYFSPNTIIPGERLEITTQGGQSAIIQIPDLTANADSAHGRIFGTGPANSTVQARLTNIRIWSIKNRGNMGGVEEFISEGTQTDDQGNYSAIIPADILYNVTCRLAQIGSPCTAPGVAYYTLEEHSVTKNYPISVESSDSFEPDDTAATASLYNGTSSHTIHTQYDTDYIKFEVTEADLGKWMVVRTTNMGFTMDTVMTLYQDQGGSLQELASNDDFDGYASGIFFTPTSAGMYYVRIRWYEWPEDPQCGLTYDFVIDRDVHLCFIPAVIR